MRKLREHLCQLDKKDMEERRREIAKVVRKARVICTHCARVAKTAGNLCSPVPLKEFSRRK